ncbi:uncharacterized protein [Symphalangus syndactylus]|uniref:uncharacterized protein isoform X2 n=1 Tax=Symphalangus syndactylus TaxID=9590 RepID=UPI002441358B|nr:uncharacterized protein LOC129472252 isoform X2 [Symphalangus syndactylus]
MGFLPPFQAGETPWGRADGQFSTLPKKGSSRLSLRSWRQEQGRAVSPQAPPRPPCRGSWQWRCWLGSTDLRPRLGPEMPGASAWARWGDFGSPECKLCHFEGPRQAPQPPVHRGCCGDDAQGRSRWRTWGLTRSWLQTLRRHAQAGPLLSGAMASHRHVPTPLCEPPTGPPTGVPL